MVNQDFVNKFLKGKDPLRQRVLVEQIIPGVTKFGPRVAWQIVGTYQNVRSAVQREANPQMFIPFWQTPWPQAGFGVRTAENPTSMLASLAVAVHSVDPVVALAQPTTMDAVRNETTADEGFTLILSSSFAALALFLAALGIYGVISFSVTSRAREIALRGEEKSIAGKVSRQQASGRFPFLLENYIEERASIHRQCDRLS